MCASRRTHHWTRKNLEEQQKVGIAVAALLLVVVDLVLLVVVPQVAPHPPPLQRAAAEVPPLAVGLVPLLPLPLVMAKEVGVIVVLAVCLHLFTLKRNDLLPLVAAVLPLK